MTISLIAIFCFLLSIAILSNAYLILFWHLPGMPTLEFRADNYHLMFTDRLKKHTRYFVYLEFSIAGFCCLFWLIKILSTFLLPKLPESKKFLMKSTLFQLWKLLARPLTLILFATSVFATISAFDDIGLLRSDVANFLNRIFYQLQNNKQNESEYHGSTDF